MTTLDMKRAARRKLQEYDDDPVYMVQTEFKAKPDPFQEEALWSFKKNERTAMKACKGPGKTTTESWAAWWFMLTKLHPKVIATSITGANLKDGLWAEMSKWQQRSELFKGQFEWKKERIESRDHPETWFMSARQWSKSADKEQQADTLAGIHADNVAFLVDEAGGIPDAVVAAAEAALATTGGTKRMMIAGNPTHLSGPLYRACTKERRYWHVIEITGDPDDPKRSPRISIEWARKQIAAYGADNPWVLVNVFGKFPPSSLNSLIGPDEMEAAQKRHLDQELYITSPKILGVDVGLQGDDPSVIMPRQGLVMMKPKVLRIRDPLQVAHHVIAAQEKWGRDGHAVDATFVDNTGGWGSGVIAKMQELGHSPIPVGYSESPMKPRFKNKRAEMAWDFVEWIRGGGCLPPCPELVEEGTAITYFYDASGKLQLVEKDQIKEELGHSTDHWDAGMQTFAYPVAAKDPLDKHRKKPASHGDYNPLAGYGHEPGNPSLADYDPLR